MSCSSRNEHLTAVKNTKIHRKDITLLLDYYYYYYYNVTAFYFDGNCSALFMLALSKSYRMFQLSQEHRIQKSFLTGRSPTHLHSIFSQSIEA